MDNNGNMVNCYRTICLEPGLRWEVEAYLYLFLFFMCTDILLACLYAYLVHAGVHRGEKRQCISWNCVTDVNSSVGSGN